MMAPARTAFPDGLQLLLVEDDDNIALLIRRGLERDGHRVAHCRTAADALDLLSGQSFDLALLDHYLPDMAGLDLLRTLQGRGIATPAVVATAYGDERLATAVLQAGALDYLVKDPNLAFLDEVPKRVQEAVHRYRLQQFNRLLSAAIESARDGIFLTDRQGTILHVNRALEQMSGYSRSELIGQTPGLLSRAAADATLALSQALLHQTGWQGEFSQVRKDGGHVEVSLTLSPIAESVGKVSHFVGIQRDVSERKRLERQLAQAQKMQSIGTLAGGVAHEFNNLLTGLTGYAALGLREPELPEQAREYFQQIVDLSERAASLTRQLLAFARSRPIARSRTPLDDLVRTTATLVEHSLHCQVNLNLQPAAADGTPLLVEADAGQLQQALINLSVNARDAQVPPAQPAETAPPIPVLYFRLRHQVLDKPRTAFPESVPPGDYAVVEVEDRGCGMSPDVVGRALDPFFTSKDVGRGTGLGLPVAFGIVRAHQGYLTLDSALGRGTCVSLYLPRLKT
jgi:PAS domain S-box-containing protein